LKIKAPHGIGKPTANRDLTPLATANGYRPADGWGVVIKHGGRERPATQNKDSIMQKPEDIAIFALGVAFLAYALWAIWPVFSLLWMLVMW